MQPAELLLPELLLSSCRVVDRGGAGHSAVGIPLGGGGIGFEDRTGDQERRKRKKRRYKK